MLPVLPIPMSNTNWELATLELATFPHWQHSTTSDHRTGVKMKRLFVILFAVVLSSASFGEIRYCEKGTKNEHSHFSSHDVPLAKGVRVKQKGPVGYSCKTNDHPLVVWSRSFDGWRVDFAIDVRKRADVRWRGLEGRGPLCHGSRKRHGRGGGLDEREETRLAPSVCNSRRRRHGRAGRFLRAGRERGRREEACD